MRERFDVTVFFFAAVLFGVGCTCGAPGSTTGDDDDFDPDTCSDEDGDGYGAGPGCRGPDCDETDPYTHTGCGENCDEHPIAIDCPCNAAEPTVCWMGRGDAQPGVGMCQSGLRYCEGGFWSECRGQVLPSEELCDHLDNDCDGQTDEGVTNPDGTCDNVDDRNGVGPAHGVGFCDEEGVCDGVEETPEGWITLGGSSVSLTHIWISNSSENTVSKLDTRTGEETGRFYTGIDASNSDPSRTAVDLDGSVYVANRAFYPPGGNDSAQASVTKIAALELDCIDANDNDEIDTSTNSVPMPWHTDECILWTEPVGNLGCAARAIAVGVVDGLDGVRFSRVYVGCFYERHVYVLDGADGDVVDDFATPNVSPYGFAITGENILFVAGLTARYTGGADQVAIVDLNDDPPRVRYSSPPSCGPDDPFGGDTINTYGIAADDQGRLWSCNVWDGCVYRYDPDSNDWDSIESSNCRGIAADGEGYIWTAYGSNVDKLDPDRMTVLATVRTTGVGGLGVAIDFDGDVWVVNEGSNNASKIDADAEREIGTYRVGTGPYTYSDMTGFQLRSITAPSGRYRRIMEVCPEEATDWASVTLDYEAPPGTSIGVRARSGNTREQLAAADWMDFGAVGTGGIAGDTIFFEGLPTARYIEIELELRRNEEAAGAPILKGFLIAGECEELIG